MTAMRDSAPRLNPRLAVSLWAFVTIALVLAVATLATLAALSADATGFWGMLAGFAVGAVIVLVLGWRLAKPVLRLAERAASGSPLDADDPLARGGSAVAVVARALASLQAERQQLHARLVHAEHMAAFGALGAGITHEVKNPITTLVGFAQLAQRKLDEPDKVLELLRIIESEGLRCRDILSSFLKFARGADRTWERVVLNDLVQRTAKLLRHQLVINNVQLELQLGEGMPAVMASPSEVQQLIVNLALNAQQAMASGGLVRLSTGFENGFVQLTVTDNGPGIPEEIQSRIFEPFFTTKAAGGGTGLGLAICAEIAKTHQGTLSVISKLGSGTTFTFRLPPAPDGDNDSATETEGRRGAGDRAGESDARADAESLADFGARSK
jgi:two-component system, NtrC family, sensor kinase